MSHETRYTPEHWEQLLESIDLEVAQLAIVCRVPLLEPGVAERVLHQDSLVCGSDNPAAFKKLRALLYMHFTARQELASELGEDEAKAIGQHIRAHLRGRVGEQLGGPAPS